MYLLIATAVLVIFSKLADILTTFRFLNMGIEELNPSVIWLIGIFGRSGGLWLTFVIFSTIVVLSTLVAIKYRDYLLVTSINIFLAIVHFAVAYSNYTIAPNFITRIIYKLMVVLWQL